MESRWYIPKGKKLESTKIEERGHALHLTEKSWNNICTHLDRNRLLLESMQREEDHKNSMKASSLAMTKNWENSVENIRKRQEEERKKNLNQKEDRNHSKFLELQKEQEEERKIYVSKMREKMSRKKDYPKALESALILGKVIYERERQREFEKEIREQERQIEAGFAETVKKNVQEEKKLQNENLKKFHDKRRIYSEELKEQINKNKLLKEKDRKEKIENELKEHDLSIAELEAVTKYKKEKELERRDRLNLDRNTNKEDIKRQREQLIQEEVEFNDVLHVINKCNDKIECMKKQKASEIIDKRSRRAEVGANKLAVIEDEREMMEEDIYKRAMAEKMAIDESKKMIELKKKIKIKEEKIKDFLSFQVNENRRLLKENEISKWHLLNRLKQTEENVKYENSLNIKSKEKSIELREQLEKQINDMTTNNDEKREGKRELKKIIAANNEEDAEFFVYAKEALDCAQQNGWPDYAIKKVILNYEKRFSKMGIPSDSSPSSSTRV